MEDTKDTSTPIAANTGFKKLSYPEVDDKPINGPYRKSTASLLYFSIYTRPYVALSVSELSLFVTKPIESHWKYVLHLLRYVKGTRHYGLYYRKLVSKAKLEAYVDASWGNCVATRR